MPVQEPDDFEPLVGGTIYVAPADYHLLVDRGRLLLSVDEPINFARPSIDVLLDSLAEAYGASSVAVVLTGASADGALGAKAVARSGGDVLVQTPATAESPIAPAAALALVPSARRLTIDGIADALARKSGGHLSPSSGLHPRPERPKQS